MQRRSTSEFIFITMRAGSPAWWASTVRSISPSSSLRRWSGATSTFSYSAARATPVSELKRSATSVVIWRSVVKSPKSS